MKEFNKVPAEFVIQQHLTGQVSEIRDGVRAVELFSGTWVAVNESTVFCSVENWRTWGSDSEALAPTDKWQTLMEGTSCNGNYNKNTQTSVWCPCGTRYRLMHPGCLASSSEILLVFPDRKCGPEIAKQSREWFHW